MTPLFAALFFLALVIALTLFVLARVQREQTGLPLGARIVYADTGAWQKVERPLFSRRYGLAGKPDYIVEQNGATVPVEVKPNRTAPEPRESDVMQLAAYALLVEDVWGVRPPYGLIKYRNVVFQVDCTDALRARVLDLLDAMRRDVAASDVARSHAEPRRCRACGYRDACGQGVNS